MKENEKLDDTAVLGLLGKWGKWASIHWRKALLIALVITIVLGSGFYFLKMELTYYSMMPKASPKVRDLKRIIENFPAASSIVVVLEAKDRSNREKAKETVKSAVDKLTEELSKPGYSKYIKQVDGKLDLDFFKNHGLMLTKKEDIRHFKRIFSDLRIVPFITNLNNGFEREYSGNEDKFSENEDTVTSQLQGLREILLEMKDSAAGSLKPVELQKSLSKSIDKFLFGSPYFLNRDGTMALLYVLPNFTINDMNMFVEGVPYLDRVIKEKADALGVKAGLTGLIVVAKDEMKTSEQGLALSTTIALTLILLLMILSFRMYSAPFISGIPLVVGILWTIGITGLVIRRLNILTAMYMIALIGLGIDYAIHLLTSFIQERDDGHSFADSVALSFRKSGAGIVMGALTTAVAFFALTVAKSSIVKELGIVAGLGILCELLAMMILIPAILGYRMHRLKKKGKKESTLLNRYKLEHRVISILGKSINTKPVLYLLITLAFGAVLSSQAYRVQVEGNLMNMEAKGLESVELQDKMVEEFGLAPDTLSLVFQDIEKERGVVEKIKKLDSVKEVESIIPFYPSREQQKKRLSEILDFRRILQSKDTASANNYIDTSRLKDELLRLKDNLLEMSDLAYSAGMEKTRYSLNSITGLNDEGKQVGSSLIDELIDTIDKNKNSADNLIIFENYFQRLMRSKLLETANTQEITLSMIPSNIRNAYISSDGKSYLANILPTQNPWVEENRKVLTDQLSTITDRATGMILAADQMTEIAEHDGIKAAITAVIVIFLLLLVDFRNLKLSILTLLPLVLSMSTLFGIMAITGIKFDFINIIAVPLLIGIGIDDAVHINHRYLLEGQGRMDTVIDKTGKAVFLTSLTTVIGFSSFIPSVMRAMKSTGIVLSIAMTLAFFFSILFHPSILIIVREKLHLNMLPWGGKKK